MKTGYNSVIFLSTIWHFYQWHVTNVITTTVTHRLVVCLYWKYMSTNEFLKKAVLLHATKSDIQTHTKCADNTKYKVRILLFTDLVTVMKSKSTGEKHACSIWELGYSFQSGLSKHTRSPHNDVESGLVTWLYYVRVELGPLFKKSVIFMEYKVWYFLLYY